MAFKKTQICQEPPKNFKYTKFFLGHPLMLQRAEYELSAKQEVARFNTSNISRLAVCKFHQTTKTLYGQFFFGTPDIRNSWKIFRKIAVCKMF